MSMSSKEASSRLIQVQFPVELQTPEMFPWLHVMLGEPEKPLLHWNLVNPLIVRFTEVPSGRVALLTIGYWVEQ